MAKTTAEKRGRGRPPKISREQILAEARKMSADELTMPALAKILDVKTPALYHHFDSRDDLIRELGKQIVANFEIPAPDGKNWRKWCSNTMVNLFEFMIKNPVLLEAGDSEGYRSMTLHLCEAMLETLELAGFKPKESQHVMLIMTSIITSAARNHIELAQHKINAKEAREKLVHFASEHDEKIPRTVKLMNVMSNKSEIDMLKEQIKWFLGAISPDTSK